MIISHKHKFVFIHIPKCAGSSIRRRLLELDPDAESYWDREWDHRLGRYVDCAHMPLADLVVRPELTGPLQEYFVFTVIRNPYSRFRSALAEYRKDNPSETIETILGRLSPTNIRHNVCFIHFCPMHYFTHIGNKMWVDSSYDFKNLEEGMVQFCETVEVPLHAMLPLPALNVTNSTAGATNKLLSSSEIALVNRLYERDFSLFGFDTVKPAEGDIKDPGDVDSAFVDLSPKLHVRGNPSRFDVVMNLQQEVEKLRVELSSSKADYQLLMDRYQHLRHKVRYLIRLRNLFHLDQS